MIYAIKFGAFGYLKFGLSANPVARLADLQTAAPIELALVCAADWPNETEGWIHAYLRETRLRGEWFQGGSDRALFVISCLQDSDSGHRRFLDAYGEDLKIVKQEQNDAAILALLRKRHSERVAWWMGEAEGHPSRARCARYLFVWDASARRWAKGPGHLIPEKDGSGIELDERRVGVSG